MSELVKKDCLPCRGGVPPLTPEQIRPLREQLSAQWLVVHDHHLRRSYTFGNFRQALDFVIQVGELAEAQNHHPDIALAWGKVDIDIWTHKIDGLTESDFILAAKIEQIFDESD